MESALTLGVIGRLSAFHLFPFPTHNRPKPSMAHCSLATCLHTCARLQAAARGGWRWLALGSLATWLSLRDGWAGMARGTATTRSCPSPLWGVQELCGLPWNLRIPSLRPWRYFGRFGFEPPLFRHVSQLKQTNTKDVHRCQNLITTEQRTIKKWKLTLLPLLKYHLLSESCNLKESVLSIFHCFSPPNCRLSLSPVQLVSFCSVSSCSPQMPWQIHTLSDETHGQAYSAIYCVPAWPLEIRLERSLPEHHAIWAEDQAPFLEFDCLHQIAVVCSLLL